MFLLLNETICNSSVKVKYLSTKPPNICSCSIRLILDDDDDSYWKDTIEKYFAQPHNEQFDIELGIINH